MKVSRISAITLIVLFLIVGICFSQNTGEYQGEGVQPDSEARFEEEYIEQIKQLVKGLEYSDKVAEDFVQMVSGWRDAQGRPVLTSWEQRLNQTEDEYKQGRISKDQLAKIEENITRELSQRIQKEISRGPGEFFNLTDVIKHKQAQCLSYSQILYVLGNSVGLSVKAIVVVEPMTLVLIPGGDDHIACMVSLTDRKMIMIDLFVFPDLLISKPFELKKEFIKVGNYWELKDKENPLGIHRRIQILDRNGLIAGIYYNRGTVYGRLGQLIKAISNFDKAIELDPKFAGAYCNRGIVYYDLGQYPKAISDYTRAIELNPEYAEAYCNRGNAYINLGQYTQAISDYTRTIELNPRFAGAYYNRGVAYACLGKFAQAKKDLLKAVELNPDLKTLVKKISDYFKLNLKLE